MSITLLDGILIVVMLISALLAMIRGFVREVLSIAAWVAAAVAAFLLYDDVLPFVQPHISQKQLALVASAGGVFVITLIIVSFITMRISDYVLDSRIGPLDRTLGFVFGAARGLLLVVVGMLFFNWFIHDEASQPSWVAEAKSRPLLNALGAQLMAALPEDPEKQILDQFQNPSIDDGTPMPDGDDAPPPVDDAAPGTAPPAVAPNDGAYRQGEQNGLDQLIQSTSSPKP
ncbi:CvpA family protein [Pleomorphomonas sp. NRK KF1]|uniref:CvpA family protein n=1 Tax=Pleomorphomonas sp. NRK KF1 TaxID=2943000 RepID=UPI002042CBBC|nr:CvpA family protein [Pleomorphomonas sp. NRK KF1]MCM5555445.1 CvpA family protein [Pleomorphomonas sp. NRK KF1]